MQTNLEKNSNNLSDGSHTTEVVGNISDLDNAKKCLESLKSVISVLENMGQIPFNKVDACVEEKPDGSIFYVISGINNYSKHCKSLPEASQALIEAGHFDPNSAQALQSFRAHSDNNKKMLDVNLGSGVITADKDYRFIIDLVATALIAAGLGAVIGKVFKLEVKRTAALASMSAVATKVIVDKAITYE